MHQFPGVCILLLENHKFGQMEKEEGGGGKHRCGTVSNTCYDSAYSHSFSFEKQHLLFKVRAEYTESQRISDHS